MQIGTLSWKVENLVSPQSNVPGLVCKEEEGGSEGKWDEVDIRCPSQQKSKEEQITRLLLQ